MADETLTEAEIEELQALLEANQRVGAKKKSGRDAGDGPSANP